MARTKPVSWPDDRSDDVAAVPVQVDGWVPPPSLTRISVDRKDACDHLRHPVSAGSRAAQLILKPVLFAVCARAGLARAMRIKMVKKREVTWHDILAER